MSSLGRFGAGSVLLLSLSGMCLAQDNNSPEGRWALTAQECRSSDQGTMFTVRLKAGAEPAVSAQDRYCRLDRKTDTRIGYRFYMHCYVSLEDFHSEQNAVLKTVVFDAIGPERMRADGHTLYRCQASG
ncbi:hypothetical protein SAMN04488144_1313 [Methylobacterium sp. 190mf]|uniref:hypothetical protein n=1 Tax=Methylobacterium sp. 190mf TaxID=1761798 RepID=UPI00089E95C0|nr:hypothetical protein [Methylobacterium sp. 190mf]SEG63712.1 hypothetical protein SAMN04488144_1313 [Methylobacterium sp. 190mf]